MNRTVGSGRCVTLAVASTALLLTGCGSSSTGAGEEGVQVIAGFYPLEWAAVRVGGERASVSSLTPPGAEAHDLELTPRDVAALTEADVVVYLDGFQPALDEAAESEAGERAWDAGSAADLAHREGEGHGHEDAGGHAGEDAGEDAGDHGGEEVVDPHFWLDPVRLAAVGDALAERLGEVDPDGAAAYAQNARVLRADLEELDEQMRAGLAGCRVRTLVTSHDAFGYLADRYGLEVVGITGLSPSQEPSPAQLARMSELVRERGVTTVYTETLVDPAVAETVAEEADVRTAVLDPIEGMTEQSAGEDYLEVMRANLETLRGGQSCT